MEVFPFFLIFILLHLVLMFFDMFLKSCMHHPYDALLRNTGFKVKIFRIDWYTTHLNRPMFKWGKKFYNPLNQSFKIGVLITIIIILPISIIILLSTIFQHSQNLQGKEKLLLKAEILIPGVNLPLNQIVYYILALWICSVFHEIGHALAAVVEDVSMTGFGFNLYFCIPIAYVDFNNEQINILSQLKRLRIYCGGIWHNILLAANCYVLLFVLNIFLQPIYDINTGVIVTKITKNSPLLGENGIFVNNIITNINDCKVKNYETWLTCLKKTMKNKPSYCVSSDFIRLNDESDSITHDLDGILQCCNPKDKTVSCFEYVDELNNNNPTEIPSHMCLNIRKTIENSPEYCINSCMEGYCIRPLVNNSTNIYKISRKQNKNIIYIGQMRDFIRTVQVSDFIPKTRIFKPNFADALHIFLKYIVIFSLGFGLTNIIPCFGLDGSYIINAIINITLVNIVSTKEKRDLIIMWINFLGTILFISSILRILITSNIFF